MRHSKLTPELLAQLDAAAGTSWNVADACAVVGISERTWHNWRSQGEADATAGTDSLHLQFLQTATRIGASRRQAAISSLRAALDDPDARHADRIAAAKVLLQLDGTVRHAVELSGPGGAPIAAAESPMDLSRLTVDELRDLHRLTLKAEGGTEAGAA